MMWLKLKTVVLSLLIAFGIGTGLPAHASFHENAFDGVPMEACNHAHRHKEAGANEKSHVHLPGSCCSGGLTAYLPSSDVFPSQTENGAGKYARPKEIFFLSEFQTSIEKPPRL